MTIALPAITLPAGFPGWAATPSARQIDAFAGVPMSTGHARRRRVYTVVPLDVQASARLNAAQAAEFDYWFETGLQAGRRPFAVLLPGLEFFRPAGAAPAWWAARFTKPCPATAQAGGYWEVQTTLRLEGPYSSAPTTAPLRMTINVGLQTKADIAQPLDLSMDILAGLITSVAN